MQSINRRRCLATLGGAAATRLLPTSGGRAESSARPAVHGQAEQVISIWLGGGMGQIDTFDPRRGDPKAKLAGAYYDAIDTAVPHVQVCEHLPELAARMEQITAVRTVHHDVIDEHAAATNRMHTGRRSAERSPIRPWVQ